MASNDDFVEHELTFHQRGLVDNCLEEGQFEAAISMLNQLRSPRQKPHVLHIWQLIYIALQSTSLPTALETDSTIYSSPSKSTLKRRGLSADAVIAAQRLLVSYTVTNQPTSIARAIPSYDNSFSAIIDAPPDDLLDSAIGTEAMCVPKAKNCWSMVAESFAAYRPGGQLPNQKHHARISRNTESEEAPVDTIVGRDAWPVLEWLLLLFEEDERLSEKPGSARCSSLLLQQIPLPRTGSGLRWDTEVPLRIISFCLEQVEEDRQVIGIRLMLLLIDLAYAKKLDVIMFTSSVFSSLAASGPQVFRLLLSSLGPSEPVHWFKVLLCQKYLNDMTSPKPRLPPQARAQPRALKSSRIESSLADVEEPSKTDPKKPNLPPYVEIQNLLELINPTSVEAASLTSPLLVHRVKFELLNSFGMLQNILPDEESDKDWVSALRDGSLTMTIDTAFGSARTEDGMYTYKELIPILLGLWSSR